MQIHEAIQTIIENNKKNGTDFGNITSFTQNIERESRAYTDEDNWQEKLYFPFRKNILNFIKHIKSSIVMYKIKKCLKLPVNIRILVQAGYLVLVISV